MEAPASAKRLAVIVDLDETLCTLFACPVAAGVAVLQRIDLQKINVHYVTSRAEASRNGTAQFLEHHRLPGRENVHYIPVYSGSREHKLKLHLRLAREFHVIASIGDSYEEAEASAAAGVPFVSVDPAKPDDAWGQLAERIAAAGGFGDAV